MLVNGTISGGTPLCQQPTGGRDESRARLYFPIADVDMDRLTDSSTTSRCPWKGKASYFDVRGESEVAADRAFTYRRAWPLARRLVTDRIAFWKDVDVVDHP